nr:type II toxin-antitoxin system RelE/ParE family toxin [Ramlibacter agri]
MPANARVLVAHSLVRDVQAVHEFLVAQDSTSAEHRQALLLQQLNEAREQLGWNPALGRPARCMEARSAKGAQLAARVAALAATHKVPHVRELVLKPYVLLYAHSDKEVVLLALKHERQQMFKLE